MKIQNIEIEKLREHCIEILSKSFMELGQKSNEEDLFSFGLILADDLKRDFATLDIEDIKNAFRLGIRTTDDFHLNVKTYYKWIKTHRQIIWDNEKIDPEFIDKRLDYKNPRIGMQKIGNIKLLK